MIIDIRLALRAIVRQPRRTAISIAAVAFGIVALMLASGFIEWIFDAMREATIRAHFGHLQIVRPGFFEAGRADPYHYLLPPDGVALETLRSLPGVRSVAPRLVFSGLASYREATLSFVAEAVDPDAEGELSQGLEIVEGVPLHSGDPRSALVGVGLAKSLGAHVGDTIVLLVTTPSGGVNATEAIVRGFFSTTTKAYDDSALRIPIDTARALLRVRGEHAWLVLLDDTRRTDSLLRQLRARLSPREYEVTPWYALADFYNKTVMLFEKQVSVMWVIVAVIIVLGITNAMMMSVMERVPEIGTAMALGDTRLRILVRFVVEGAGIGVLGGVIGLALGYALAAWISSIGIPMPAPPGMAHGYVGQILITPKLAIEAMALAFATAVVASLYPAWKASRLQIVDALRRSR